MVLKLQSSSSSQYSRFQNHSKKKSNDSILNYVAMQLKRGKKTTANMMVANRVTENILSESKEQARGMGH